jgi:hypothetical protein
VVKAGTNGQISIQNGSTYQQVITGDINGYYRRAPS